MARTNAHGRYKDAASTTYGAKIEFVCDQGYQLESGDQERTCTEGKSWTGSDPTCGAISCPSPDAISYGTFTAHSYTVGSNVTYACVPGYQLSGNASRTCLANETWTGTVPQCRRIECDKPGEVISNGRMISSNFSYGATIHYVCDPGYFMDEGGSSRTCTASGAWDGPIPTCNRVECPRPGPPANCFVEGFDLRFKEHITYICKSGFELVGEMRRTCQADKTWSGTEPRCVTIQVSRVTVQVSDVTIQVNSITIPVSRVTIQVGPSSLWANSTWMPCNVVSLSCCRQFSCFPWQSW